MKRVSLALLLLPMAGVAQAQAIKNEPPMREFTQEEVDSINMPDLTFEETEDIRDDYEKYFYFHREDTSFETAFADILECDLLASGLTYRQGTALGGYGGALGGLLSDAIYGSSMRRHQRRVNLRNCMSYKEYGRYGLPKSLWVVFNFEEGLRSKDPLERERDLLVQAKVASGPVPSMRALKP